MAVVVFGFTSLLAAVIYAVVVLPVDAGPCPRLRGGYVVSMATVFALFVAFTAAQVWTDNDRAAARHSVSFISLGLRAKAAVQRAMALDPSRVVAATDLINMESEEGRLNESYDEIVELLHKSPDSGAVHLVYSYVLWYAGLLDESKQERERARSLDPGTTDLASCQYIFMALGRYDRARAFFQLQSGTEYETAGLVEIRLREGKPNISLQVLRSLPSKRILRQRTVGAVPATWCGQKWCRARKGCERKSWGTMTHFRSTCWQRGIASAGEPSSADRELRRAIQQKYCAYPQIETDPLLVTLRDRG
jgi:hypothetical protein